MAHFMNDGTAYETHGAEQNPSVVLIHGLGLNAQVWQWLVPALIPNYHVITYDLFGHGESANPPVTPSLSLFSNQLEALLDHCNVEKAVVAGFSLGGMIARRFAQDHISRVEALAIINSAHKRSDEAQAAIVKRVEQAAIGGPAATIEDALIRWFSDKYRAENPAVMDIVRKWVKANHPAVYPGIYAVLAQGIDEIVAPSPAIECPALVITAEQDYGNSPEMSEQIATEMKNSETVILKGLRHMALMEDPEQFNKAFLSFLSRLY